MGNLSPVPKETKEAVKAKYIEVLKLKTYDASNDTEDDIFGRRKFECIIMKFLKQIKLFRCKKVGAYDTKKYYKEMLISIQRKQHVNLKIKLTIGKYQKFEDEVNDWIKKIKKLLIVLDKQLEDNMVDNCTVCEPPCSSDDVELIKVLLMCIQFPISNALKKLRAENGVVKFLREKYGIRHCRGVPRRMSMFDSHGNRLGKKQFKLKDD
uniref:SRI domain-containing protein n=1 Tax=Parastrongyloides trichosuri TaxID=131310 RepID=A0A0N4ZY43_PARTI